MQKNWFNVKVTARAYIMTISVVSLLYFCCISKYDYFCCIFKTTGQFATKLGLIVQHHKLKCPVKKRDYYGQGQGHNRGLKCQWMFVRMIFSESEHFVTKFGMMMKHHDSESCWHLLLLLFSRSRTQQGSYDQNMALSNILFELLIPWQPNMVWWTSSETRVSHEKKLDYCILSQGHSEGSKCNVCPDDIF